MSGRTESLQWSATRRDDVHTVRVQGEIDLQSAPRLRTLLDDLLKQKPRRLLLDLSGVSYIDSSGVGTIVYVKREIERLGGRMILCGLQARVRSVFEITQLDRFFTITTTLDEALKA